MKTKFVLFCMVSSMAVSLIHSKELAQSNIFYDIVRGNSKSLKMWLKSKQDLSVRNEQGQTFLMASVLTGQCDLVKMFVKAGMDLNVTDDEGKTALDHAVEYGHVKIICHLVKSGGKVTTLSNLYHLKSVMKDYAITLYIRTFIVSLVLLVLGFPCWVSIMTVGTIICTPAATILGIVSIGLCVYTVSLLCRAYSWNKASNNSWMRQSIGLASLN